MLKNEKRNENGLAFPELISLGFLAMVALSMFEVFIRLSLCVYKYIGTGSIDIKYQTLLLTSINNFL